MSRTKRFHPLLYVFFLFFSFDLFCQEAEKDAIDGEHNAQFVFGQDLLSKKDSRGWDFIFIASLQGHLKAIDLLEPSNNYYPEIVNYKNLIISQCQDLARGQEFSDTHKKDLRKNGNAGDVNTQYCMWIYYVNHLGIQKPEAYTWLKQAAGNNHPGALMSLGLLYLYGYIVPEEEPQAIRLLKKSKDRDFILSDIALKIIEKAKNN